MVPKNGRSTMPKFDNLSRSFWSIFTLFRGARSFFAAFFWSKRGSDELCPLFSFFFFFFFCLVWKKKSFSCVNKMFFLFLDLFFFFGKRIFDITAKISGIKISHNTHTNGERNEVEHTKRIQEYRSNKLFTQLRRGRRGSESERRRGRRAVFGERGATEGRRKFQDKGPWCLSWVSRVDRHLPSKEKQSTKMKKYGGRETEKKERKVLKKKKKKPNFSEVTLNEAPVNKCITHVGFLKKIDRGKQKKEKGEKEKRRKGEKGKKINEKKNLSGLRN